MLTILACFLLAATPVVGAWVLFAVLERPRGSRFRRIDAALPGWHSSKPIERLGRDLHRLAVDFDRTEHANEPHKAARLRATSIAYDDVLVAAACALDVPAPPRAGHEPLDPLDRLTVEAELARAGLSW
jgi:hypothetical protein